MKNMKAVILIAVTLILSGSLVYLTLLIQDGSNPLGMFGIRASNPEEEVDPFLSDNPVLTETPVPSPTEIALAYNSTSPTVTPPGSEIATESAAITATPTMTPTETPTPSPTLFNVALEDSDPTPTAIQTLPVSGITDHLDTFLIGGGILILLGLLL